MMKNAHDIGLSKHSDEQGQPSPEASLAATLSASPSSTNFLRPIFSARKTPITAGIGAKTSALC
jgi:hypothetical protein